MNKKWEYMIVYYNGNLRKAEQGLDGYGQNGWEAYAVTYQGMNSGMIFLKREV